MDLTELCKKAEQALKSKQHLEAYGLYSALIACAGSNTDMLVEGYVSRSMCAVGLGKLSEAEADARTAVQLKTQRADAHAALGYVLVQQGQDYAAARASLAWAAQLKPPPNLTDKHLSEAEFGAKWQLNLGLRYFLLAGATSQRADFVAAAAAFQRAVALDGSSKEHQAWLAKAQGKLAILAEDWRGAAALYGRAVELDPTAPMPHNQRGFAYLQLGSHEAAADCFSRALQLAPSNAMFKANLEEARRRAAVQAAPAPAPAAQSAAAPAQACDKAAAENQRGLAYLQQGQWAAALACFSRAAQVAPANATYKANMARAHYKQGDVHFDAKNYSAALAEYTSAVQLDPSFALAHNDCGVCHYNLGNWAAAVSCYERALALNPSDALCQDNLLRARKAATMQAAATSSRLHPAAAATAARIAAEAVMAPSVQAAELGNIHFKHKNYEAALAAYSRAVELEPSNAVYQKFVVEARRKAEKHRAKAQAQGTGGSGGVGSALAIVGKVGFAICTGGAYIPS